MDMKRILYIISISLAVACASGCIAGYEKINTNPYEATDEHVVADDYLIQGALKTMLGYYVPSQEHQFQFMNILCGSTLGGYLAEQKGWETKTSTYNPNDEWAAYTFEKVIPGIYGAYIQLTSSTDDPIATSVAEIVNVATFVQLSDIYGPLPYSKIGLDGSLVAEYDSQEDIYNIGFEKLTAAINTLTERSTSVLNANADIIYGGDLKKWIRFANTIKLRMAMRIVYADPTKAQQMAQEAVNHSFGVITTNADNAAYSHPTQNNYYLCCIQWGDYRVAADIACYMNGYKDPRRAAYFTESNYSSLPYAGWRRGTRMEDSNGGNPCSNVKVKMDDKMQWLNAAEATFLRAEGALRGWNMGGDAQDLYEEAIRLSFEQWSTAGADAYIADASSTPTDYTDLSGKGYGSVLGSRITIAWDKSGDFEKNLEKIITQKWIANWRGTGVEGWFEFRRTGYPKLMPAGANLSNGVIAEDGFARRLPFPINELTNNTENYRKAVSEHLGGADNMATRVWWDCNPKTE